MKVNKYLIKTKDRIVHEFEYKNGKYIQHYVLGGDHEMQPQDIIDCLNALATMDCDLAQCHAYIEGQQEENIQLKEELKVLKLALELACEDISLYEDITTSKYKTKCYIQKAKEKLNADKTRK